MHATAGAVTTTTTRTAMQRLQPGFGRLLLSEITMERPCRCPPLIKRLSPSFTPFPFSPCAAQHPSRCSNFSSLRPRPRSSFHPFPFFIPARRSFPLFSLLLARRNVCIARRAEWPAGSGTYVGFMNFICSDKTMRIYSRQVCRQFGWIFIDGYFFFPLLAEESSFAVRRPKQASRKREIIGRGFFIRPVR